MLEKLIIVDVYSSIIIKIDTHKVFLLFVYGLNGFSHVVFFMQLSC